MIGKRKQVQLVFIPNEKADAGNWQEQPAQTYNRWAEITNPSGFRDYINGQTHLGQTKKFLIRFDFDLFPGADWKIRYSGKDWTISNIDKVDEKRFYWNVTAASK